MTTTPPHRPDPDHTHGTDPDSTGAAAGHPTRPTVADVTALCCSECREPASAVPPTEWPLAGWAPRTAYSHLDGTELCPVPVLAPGGSGPAEPVAVPARLTVWQAVRQSWLIHPDWTVTDHLAWLDDEAYDLDAMHGDPATVIAGWLAWYRRAATGAVAGSSLPDPPVPSALPVGPAAPPEAVHVVAGGSMVAAFADEASAGIQHDVMTLAGIDTTAYRLTWARWVQVRAELRARHPETVIIDVSGGDQS